KRRRPGSVEYGRGHARVGPQGSRGCAFGRHGPVVTGLFESRHVREHRGTRRCVRGRGKGARSMSAAVNGIAAERQVAGAIRAPGYDGVLLAASALLLCIGIVFVTSASIALAERQTGNALYFTERQLLYATAGALAAVFM